jgi:hypothetical protein
MQGFLLREHMNNHSYEAAPGRDPRSQIVYNLGIDKLGKM